MFDTAADPSGRRGPFTRLLNLVWAGIYAIGLVSNLWATHQHLLWIVSGIGLAAWVLRALISDRMATLQTVAEAVMVIAGGIACVPANVLGGVPLAVALILTIGRPERAIWVGISALPVGLASIGVGALLVAPSLADPDVRGRLFGAAALLVISALVAVSRRQSRTAERRNRELIAERLRAERLDEHAAVARDLHDVLAHGLGGLVIQLDAVDALIESGRVDDAATRVRAARRLAVEGLSDARRAVDALRSDDRNAPPVSPVDLIGMLTELLDAHRTLGGAVDALLDAGDSPVPSAHAAALRRTLQEALSNARKHASGEPVEVRLRSTAGRLELTVSNPLGASGELAATGGGRGLAGMRERFAELPEGSVEAGAAAGRFTVRAVAAR